MEAFRVPRDSLLAAAAFLGLVGLIGWLDLSTGPDYGFGFFYLIAVVPAAWFVGRSSGFVVGLAAGLAWFLADVAVRTTAPADAIAWNAASGTALFLAAAFLADRVRRDRDALQRADADRKRFVRSLEQEVQRSADALVALTLRGLRRPAGAVTPDDMRALHARAEEIQFLSRDFAALVRLQSGALRLDRKTFDIVELIEEIRTQRIGAQRIPLTRPAEPVFVWGDRARLRQVLEIGFSRLTGAGSTSEVAVDIAVAGKSARVTLAAAGRDQPVRRADDADIGFELAQQLMAAHSGEL
ncbi:MAG TPA: hypothetical protein VF998_05125, partial [Candidatus Limnocylindria bacterium]